LKFRGFRESRIQAAGPEGVRIQKKTDCKGLESILAYSYSILDSGFWLLDPGFWLLDPGFWLLDF